MALALALDEAHPLPSGTVRYAAPFGIQPDGRRPVTPGAAAAPSPSAPCPRRVSRFGRSEQSRVPSGGWRPFLWLPGSSPVVMAR